MKSNLEELEPLITIMAKDSTMQCFQKPESLCHELRQRLECNGADLIKQSANSYSTKTYDLYQFNTLGINL